jgi:uncharacterized membrane protein YeaQ/YmgE (transglycosylase-associated protein family)
VIGFLVAGLIIGALARLVKSGKQNLSVIATLLLGLVGSVIGGVIANLFGTGNIFELNVLGFIVAVIASVLLIGVAEAVTGNKPRGPWPKGLTNSMTRARIWGDIGGRVRTVFVLSGGVLSTVIMPDTEEVTGSIPISPTSTKSAPDLRKRGSGAVLYVKWT